MTVWVLINDCCGHDGLYGIFSTREKAEAAKVQIEAKKNEYGNSETYVSVEERVVDEEPS